MRLAVPRAFFLAGIFVAYCALLIVAARITGGDGSTPPPPGDTQDYDNIAVQLLHGRGFAIDYSDPEWRRPYEEHNREGEFDEILARKIPFHITTYRPPLLPFALALTYRIFGRDFLTWRIIEAVLTALALTLVSDVAWRALGSRVALIAAGLMFLSATYVHYVANVALMTEPLAIVMVAVIVWTLSRAGDAHPYAMAAACGVALALLCLTRSFYLAWLPFLAILIWRIAPERGARAAVIFVIVALAVQTPWWIRNCRVTGTFLPFGTQAGVAMHTAYSDLAIVHHGIWWNARPEQQETAYAHEIGPCRGCSEVELARYGMRGGSTWATRHLARLPTLAWWKIANTWETAIETGMIAPLFWLVLFAPLILWRRRALVQGKIVFAIVLLVIVNMLVIAMTWSVGWRFLVPVEPLLAVLAAVPIVTLLNGESAVVA